MLHNTTTWLAIGDQWVLTKWTISKIKADRLFVSPDREQLSDSLTTYSKDFIKIAEDLYSVLSNKKEQLDSFRFADKYFNLQPEEIKSLSLEDKKKRERKLEKLFEDSLTITIVNSLLDYFLNHCNEHIWESRGQRRYRLFIYAGVGILLQWFQTV